MKPAEACNLAVKGREEYVLAIVKALKNVISLTFYQFNLITEVCSQHTMMPMGIFESSKRFFHSALTPNTFTQNLINDMRHSIKHPQILAMPCDWESDIKL